MEAKMEIGTVNAIVERYHAKRTSLISILHDIQEQYNFLPEMALRKVASRLQMDLNDLYGVATFYKSFSLVPKGRHTITLCLGTACHVRGGPKMLREMKRQLAIEPGQTTKDQKFSLEVVNCLGVCAIGPVMVVDGKIYGEMNWVKARRIIERIHNRGNGGKA
jgi:NADH-quinone oxidoreductase subunit E